MCTQPSAWSCTYAVGSNQSALSQCAVGRGRSLLLTCCVLVKRRCVQQGMSHKAQVQLNGCCSCSVKCARAGSGSCSSTPRLETSLLALQVAVPLALVKRSFYMRRQAPPKFVRAHRDPPTKSNNQRCASSRSRLGRRLSPALSVLWAIAARACVFAARDHHRARCSSLRSLRRSGCSGQSAFWWLAPAAHSGCRRNTSR